MFDADMDGVSELCLFGFGGPIPYTSATNSGRSLRKAKALSADGPATERPRASACLWLGMKLACGAPKSILESLYGKSLSLLFAGDIVGDTAGEGMYLAGIALSRGALSEGKGSDQHCFRRVRTRVRL